MESWRQVWRDGFVPALTTAELCSLRDALRADDPRLIQGGTTTPPPLMAVEDWPVEAACALGFCGWQGDGLETVGEVERFFARICFVADQFCGEPAACRWFLNWFDDTPRGEVFRELLAEVELAIAERDTDLHRMADDGCPHVPCPHGSPDAPREPISDASESNTSRAGSGETEAAAHEGATAACC